MLQYELMN